MFFSNKEPQLSSLNPKNAMISILLLPIAVLYYTIGTLLMFTWLPVGILLRKLGVAKSSEWGIKMRDWWKDLGHKLSIK